MPAPPPDFVQAQMPRDRKNPGGKLGRNLVAPGGLKNTDEDILRQVLRFIQVMQHPIDHIDNGLLVFLDQFLKSLEVSVFNAEHQRGIGVHGQCHLVSS